MHRRRGLAVMFVFLLLSGTLGGCLGFRSRAPVGVIEPGAVDFVASKVLDGLDRATLLRARPLEMPVDITIHVVFVGIDTTHVDTDAIAGALPKDYSPLVRFDRAQISEQQRSGLTQNLRYEFHEAPDAFARELFAYYPQASREAAIDGNLGPAPGFLQRYDVMYQLGRTASGRMHIVDAEKVEAWMQDHRAAAGLSFADPEYTVFFLDSYTKYHLWKDSYYWYEYAREAPTNPDAVNLRAWGGTHDFLFMDYSAAPNDALYDNVGVTAVDPFGPGVTPVPAPAPEGTAYNDPPVWHYRDGVATIGLGPLEKTVTLTDRIRHALDVGINLRIIGDYNQPPVYAERYHINVHLWHDGRSIMPQDGLDKLIPLDTLLDGLQREVPWTQVTGTLHTYVAPKDDPGMAAALDSAKAQGGATYIPTPPITNYVDAHRDRYVEDVPGAVQIIALLFLLEGHYSFVLPVVVGGVSLTSADGLGWGTISSVADFGYIGTGRDMQRVAHDLVGINSHEIGHHFGLYHAHDGYRRNATGYEPLGDHTWSSTNTVMSYRLRPPTTDTFHRDLLARGHTLANLDRTQRNVETTYRALASGHVDATPEAVRTLLSTATTKYNEAHQAHDAGHYEDAVRAAIEARRASEAAMASSGVTLKTVNALDWSSAGVNSVGAKSSALTFEAAAVPTGVVFDLKPLVLDGDVDSVTVRVTWTNTPTSWGDFLAAWQAEGMLGTISFGPTPVGKVVDVGGGVHDSRAEGPMDGTASETFTLDLDAFPALREGKTLLVGAGTRGDAVNGAYHVEVLTVVRTLPA